MSNIKIDFGIFTAKVRLAVSPAEVAIKTPIPDPRIFNTTRFKMMKNLQRSTLSQ